jgi:hypothetical protein
MFIEATVSQIRLPCSMQVTLQDHEKFESWKADTNARSRISAERCENNSISNSAEFIPDAGVKQSVQAAAIASRHEYPLVRWID